jgi:hypothetical protein
MPFAEGNDPLATFIHHGLGNVSGLCNISGLDNVSRLGNISGLGHISGLGNISRLGNISLRLISHLHILSLRLGVLPSVTTARAAATGRWKKTC